jgi:hypothetical protein
VFSSRQRSYVARTRVHVIHHALAPNLEISQSYKRQCDHLYRRTHQRLLIFCALRLFTLIRRSTRWCVSTNIPSGLCVHERVDRLRSSTTMGMKIGMLCKRDIICSTIAAVCMPGAGHFGSAHVSARYQAWPLRMRGKLVALVRSQRQNHALHHSYEYFSLCIPTRQRSSGRQRSRTTRRSRNLAKVRRRHFAKM